MGIFRAYLRLAARWRWSLLLGLILADFVLQPLTGYGAAGDLVAQTLFAAIVAGAIVAADIPARPARIGLAIALAWLALQGLAALGLYRGIALPLLSVAMLGGVLAATFAYLVGQRDSARQALTGAVFGYFLLIMAWAMLFTQLETHAPGAFTLDPGAAVPAQLTYFSLVTITTLGYGDILPATPLAQVLAGLAAASGVLYVGVLVGSIVGGFQGGGGQGGDRR